MSLESLCYHPGVGVGVRVSVRVGVHVGVSVGVRISTMFKFSNVCIVF